MEKSKIKSEVVTPEIAVEYATRLGVAFPKLSDPFLALLVEKVIECGFTGPQLERGINQVIKNHMYGEPTIAEVLATRPDPNKRLCRFELTLPGVESEREAPYGQYLIDCNRYGKENMRFIEFIEPEY